MTVSCTIEETGNNYFDQLWSQAVEAIFTLSSMQYIYCNL